MSLFRLWLAVLLLALLSLGWRSSQGVELETDIRALLPQAAPPPVVASLAQSLEAEGLRRSLLLLGAPTAAEARRAGEAAARSLDQTAIFQREDPSQYSGQVDPLLLRAAPFLLSSTDRELLRSQEADYWVGRALGRVAGWGDLLGRTDFATDPFGLLDGFLSASAPEADWQPSPPCLLRQAEGLWWCLLPLQTQAAGFGLEAVQAQVQALEAARAAAQQSLPGVQLRDSGVARHAALAAQRSKSEMGRISLLSVLLISALVWGMLGRGWPLLLALSALGTGALCGLAACVWFFGQVHLVALVFGVAMGGVAVDYVFHFLCAQGAGEERAGEIGRGVGLGLLTSLLGLAALCLTPIPGLVQIALCAIGALIGAALTVLGLYPRLPAAALGRLRPGAAEWVGRLLQPRFGRWPLGIGLAVLLLALFGGLQLQGGENVRALYHADADLLQADAQARALVGGVDGAQALVLAGADVEAVLEQGQLLLSALRQARAEGLLREWLSPLDGLPPLRQQKADAELRAQALNAEVERGLRQTLGLPAEWWAQQQAQAAQPLQWEDWVQTAEAERWSGLWDQSPERVAIALRFGGVQDVPALRDRLLALQQPEVDLYWLDPLAEASAALERTRRLAGQILMGVGLGLILLLVGLFGPRRGLVLLLPTAAAVLLNLGWLGWTQSPYSLFHLLALLLVLGMSLDYALFLQLSQGQRARALLAVLLSAATTLGSFGLLALSSTPALGIFGGVVLLGLIGALGATLMLAWSGLWSTD